MVVLYITTRRSLRKSQKQTVGQHLDSFAEIWILAPQAKILSFRLSFYWFLQQETRFQHHTIHKNFRLRRHLCHTTLSHFNTYTIIRLHNHNVQLSCLVLEDLDLGSGLALDSLEQRIALLKNIELKKLWCLTQQCARAWYAWCACCTRAETYINYQFYVASDLHLRHELELNDGPILKLFRKIPRSLTRLEMSL